MSPPFHEADHGGVAMRCPPDIADVVAELLYRGIIRARAFAHPGYEKRCFIETDHVHNLPHIINDFKVDRLEYYWNIERPLFMKQVPANETQDLAPLWDQLSNLMKSHGISPAEIAMATSRVG
jgi:hypothetical protein